MFSSKVSGCTQNTQHIQRKSARAAKNELVKKTICLLRYFNTATDSVTRIKHRAPATFGSINCARKMFFVLLQLHQPSSLFKSLEILGPFLRKGITEQFRSQRVRADYSEKHKRAKEIVKAYKAFCRKNSRRNAAVGFLDFFGPRRRQESRL